MVPDENEVAAQLRALGDGAPALDWELLRSRRSRRVRRRRLEASLAVFVLAGAVIGLVSGTRAGGQQRRDDVVVTPATADPRPTATSDVLMPTVTGRPGTFDRNRFLPDTAAFTSGSEGWVVGARCSTSACRTDVDHTTDAGATWSTVGHLAVDLTPSAGFAVPVGQVHLVVANNRSLLADEERGYAAGLQVSNDGGHTWTTPTLPGLGPLLLADVAATSDSFWILASDQGVDRRRLDLYRLDFRSSDATLVGHYPPDSTLSSAPSTARDGVAYLTTYGSTALVILGSRGTTRATLPHRGCPPAVSSTGDLVLGCQDGAAAGSGGKLAWLSTDRGTSWIRLPDPPFSGDLVDLTEISSGRYLLNTSGGASMLTLTTDGGRSWRDTLAFGDGGEGIHDVDFPNGQDGYAIHGGPRSGELTSAQEGGVGSAQYAEGQRYAALDGLYATTDGGASWHHVALP
jgi:photosystem II stability/assembly factor-like uncharacterized protein